jgi:PAS domain S-box-containing protein
MIEPRQAEAALRQKAEEIVREKADQSSEQLEALLPEETRQMLHELRVHQIELEMQNEELRRAQVELDIARARYFDLYDLAVVGHCTLSEQGLILGANLTAASLLGVSRCDLVKRRLTTFILPEDEGIYYRHRKQLFENGEPLGFELRMVKNDGTQFWARLEAIAANDEESMPVLRIVLTDITERKLAEEALRGALAKYKTLFECFPLGITVSDEAGNILESNPTAEKLLSMPQAEQTQKDIDSPEWHIVRLDGTPMPPDEFASVRALKEKRVVENVEMGIVKPDHTITWISVTAAPLPIEGHGVVITYGDITEHKRAEQALLLSEAKYRTLHESMRDAFVRVNMEGQLIEWNSAYAELLGYSTDELCNLTYQDLTPSKWHKMETGIVNNQVLVRGYSDVFEKEYRRKDGTVFPVELRVFLLRDGAGQPTGMWAITRDVTERCQFVTELEQKEKDIRLISDSVPVGICRRNKKNICIYANSQYAKCHSMSLDQIIGSHVQDAVGRARYSKLKPYLNEVMKGNPVSFDEEFTDSDGSQRSRHVSLVPDRATDGSIQGYFAMDVDTTEMRAGHLAIEKANRQLEAQQSLLIQKNVALEEILNSLQRERDKGRHEICESILSLLAPIAIEIRRCDTVLSKRTLARLDDLEKRLSKDLLKDYANLRMRLSPREIDVCELIRKGMCSKDISEQLHISVQTATKHRYSIRKKLQIRNTNLNLASFLRRDM